MRKILIVGAGQSGLHLAHDLLGHGYDVTLMTGESSAEIRNGRPHIAQFTLPSALELERELHLDFWSGQAPRITGTTVRLYPPASAPISVAGAFGGYAIAVDRRVKMADWLEYFEDRGGKVVIHGCTVTDLDYFSRMFDLIVVAVGHGELGGLFDAAPDRFGGARPRLIAQALIDGVTPAEERADQVDEYVEVGSAPEARVFLAPTLTSGGPCHALVIVEGPGGQIGRWPRSRRMDPTEQWSRMQELLRDCTPDLYTRVKGAFLVGGRSTTIHEVRPQVRRPVGYLPSGGCVLGVADVVVSTDPIAAQGWSNSTMSAAAYRARIVDHGDAPFTQEWMAGSFELFWSGATQHRSLDGTAGLGYAGAGEASARLSDALDRIWDFDAPAHLGEVVAAAAVYPEVAGRFIRGLDTPRDYDAWLYDPTAAREYLREVAQRHT